MRTQRSSREKHLGPALVNPFVKGLTLLLALIVTDRFVHAGPTECMETAKLMAQDPTGLDFVGGSIAAGENVAFTGAYFQPCADGSDCGAAYVFGFNGSNWTQQQKLTAPVRVAGDGFGLSVALSANLAIVGAPGDDCSGGTACDGAAYVYRFDGTNWVIEQKLAIPIAQGGGFLGQSVAVEGDVAAAGAPLDDCPPPQFGDCGAVYVFRHNGSAWIQEQVLRLSEGSNFDSFGESVSLSGGVLAAGAPGANAVYIYRYNGSQWLLEQKLGHPEAGVIDDSFGSNVSLDGSVVLIGNFVTGEPPVNTCGLSYLFRFDGQDWLHEQTLSVPAACQSTLVVPSVSVNGGVAVVGYSLVDCAGGGNDCGAAYVFRYDGSQWIEEMTLTASDGMPSDWIGDSVAVHGSRVFVGGTGINCEAGNRCGAVYVFDCLINVPAMSPWTIAVLSVVVCAASAIVIRSRLAGSSSR